MLRNPLARSSERWTDSRTVTDATSTPIYIPRQARNVSVGVTGTFGTATVEATLAARSAVAANPAGVNWYAWEDGEVSAETVAALNGAVTAVRIVATGGPITLEVTGDEG
jgi:hypothetical protein